MTVNYTVMHCNSDNKTRPNSVAYVVRLLPSEHTAAKKYYRKKIPINADKNVNM